MTIIAPMSMTTDHRAIIWLSDVSGKYEAITRQSMQCIIIVVPHANEYAILAMRFHSADTNRYNPTIPEANIQIELDAKTANAILLVSYHGNVTILKVHRNALRMSMKSVDEE
jgi:hypothetical protein